MDSMAEFIAEGTLFLTALVLVVWGFQQRQQYETRRDGKVKLTIGVALLGALGLVLTVSALVGPPTDPDGRQDITAEASSESDLVLDGADRYLRGIDQVRVTGEFDGGRAEVTFVQQKDAVGEFTTANGIAIRFMHVDGDTYIKPSDSFWARDEDPEALIDLVDGRWIQVDTKSGRFEGMDAFADRDEFRKPLGVRKYTDGTSENIRGVECIVVEPSTGGALYLARDPSRLMRIEDADGFIWDLDYDAPTVVVEAPSAAIEGSEVFESSPSA